MGEDIEIMDEKYSRGEELSLREISFDSSEAQFQFARKIPPVVLLTSVTQTQILLSVI